MTKYIIFPPGSSFNWNTALRFSTSLDSPTMLFDTEVQAREFLRTTNLSNIAYFNIKEVQITL